MEFYRPLVRINVVELDNRLVSRYIGGMRKQFQDSLNFIDLVNVSEAH